MSILIKGMEMPSIGTYEALIDVTNINGKTAISVFLRDENDSRRFSVRVYEVVPVPPHGRLGDLDEINEKHDKLSRDFCHGYFKSTWDFVCAARKIFYDAPTIIPAEEGE